MLLWAWSVLAAVAFASIEEEGPYRRWALIPSAEISQAGLADLLTIELQALGLELVERERIDAILEEFARVDALGAEQTEGRLRLGRMLGADALLIVRGAAGEEGAPKNLDVLIADCVFGARLRVDRIALDAARPEQAITEIATALGDTLQQFPRGVERIICIPPFVSKSLEQKFDFLQARLAFVLQASIARHPGVALLEVGEAKLIQRELSLRGEDRKAAATPLFVEGEYRAAWNADRQAPDFDVQVRVSGRDAAPREYAAKLESIEGLTEALRREVAEGLLAEVLASPQRDLPAAARVARLAARSDAFARLDLLDEAIELREALLLLHPARGDQALRLLDLYKLRFELRTDWRGNFSPEPKAVRDWIAQLDAWPQALDVVARAIRHRAFTQFEALAAHEDLFAMIDGFSVGSRALAARRAREEDPGQAILEKGAACHAAYRGFMDAEFLQIRKLAVGTLRDPQPEQRKRDPNLEAYERWLAAQLKPRRFERRPDSESDLEVFPERFQRMVDVLVMRAEDMPVIHVDALLILRSAAFDERRPSGVTAAQFEAAIARLSASPLEMNKIYADVARVCYAHRFAPDGERPTPEQTVAALQQISDRIAPRLGRDAHNGIPVLVRMLQRSLERRAAAEPAPRAAAPRTPSDADPNRPTGELGQGPLPPRVVAAPSRMHAVPIPMEVSRLDGRIVPMHSQEWAQQPGYVEIAGNWLRLVRCGTVDVLFNAATVLLHDRPGHLRELRFSQGRSESRRSVVWDGGMIWVADVDDGVWVIRPDGSTVCMVSADTGLPPFGAGLLMQPVSPGRTLIVGLSGEGARAWIADVRIEADRPAVRVIHEATVRYSDVALRAQDLRDAKATFVPTDAHLLHDPLDGGKPHVMIQREEARQWPLRVDLAEMTVSVAACARRLAYRSMPGRWHFLTNGDFLILNKDRDCISVAAGGARLFEDGSEARELHRQTGITFWGEFFEFKGYLYAPGAEWLRINPETLAVERLGRGPLWRRAPGDRGWGVSAHFGLIAWDGAWRFWDLRVSEASAAEPVSVARVRIVDAESAAPIPGARIAFREFAGDRWVKSDAEGIAAADLTVSGAEGIGVDVHADGYWSRGLTLTGAREELQDGTLTVALQRPLRIGGRVTSLTGAPVSGLEVQIVQRGPGDSAERRAERTLPAGRTELPADPVIDLGPDGRWEAVFPPADLRRLSLVLAGPERLENSDSLRPLDREAPEALRLDFDDQTPGEVLAALRRGEHEWRVDLAEAPAAAAGAVAIRIVDPVGAPVGDGEVELWRRRGMPTEHVPILGGSLTLAPEQAEGTSQLIIRVPGFAPRVEELRRNPAQSTIVVEPSQPLEVRVRSADGEPVSGARVRSGDGQITLFEEFTDSFGRVRWEQAPPRVLDLTAEKAGWVSRALPASESDAGVREFVLTPRTFQTIRVRAVDAATRKPLPAFSVRHARTDHTADAGGYAVEVASDDSVKVTLSAAGYVSERVSVRGGGDAVVDVLLRRGNALSGTLRTADGRILADTTVVIWKELPQSVSIVSTGRILGGTEVQTDPDGRFSGPANEGKTGALYYGEHGFALADDASIAASGELVVQPNARIEGVVSPDARPDGAALRAVWKSTAQDRRSGDGPRIELEAPVVADGRFVLENIPPGAGWVMLQEQRWIDTGPGRRSGVSARTSIRSLSLAANDAISITLAPTGRAVAGRFDLPEPVPRAASLVVDLDPKPRRKDWPIGAPGAVPCEPDASFRFTDVAPGTYALSATWKNAKGDAPTIVSRIVEIPDDPGAGLLDLGTLPLEVPEEQRADRRTREPRAQSGARGDATVAWLQYGAGGVLAVAIVLWVLRGRSRAGAARRGGTHAHAD